jgi:succinate dehydrogenase subunit C
MVQVLALSQGSSMSARVQYTLYHPKWYRRPVSVWWWLENWSYTKFVLRELTSVFVAFLAVIILWQLRALVAGPEAYAQFMARLKSPLFLVLHVVAFFFILYHTITWFNLAPKAMVLRLSGKRVPDFVIVALNYLTWLVASVVVAWFFLRG